MEKVKEGQTFMGNEEKRLKNLVEVHNSQDESNYVKKNVTGTLIMGGTEFVKNTTDSKPWENMDDRIKHYE